MYLIEPTPCHTNQASLKLTDLPQHPKVLGWLLQSLNHFQSPRRGAYDGRSFWLLLNDFQGSTRLQNIILLTYNRSTYLWASSLCKGWNRTRGKQVNPHQDTHHLSLRSEWALSENIKDKGSPGASREPHQKPPHRGTYSSLKRSVAGEDQCHPPVPWHLGWRNMDEWIPTAQHSSSTLTRQLVLQCRCLSKALTPHYN